MNRPAIPTGQGMSLGDVARVLAMAAAFDQRTTSDADVQAWHQVAGMFQWRTAWAARVVVEHYGENTDRRIMPGHITKRIREKQNEFCGTYQRKAMPDHVRGVDAEVAWESARLAEHVERCMDAWATGGAR